MRSHKLWDIVYRARAWRDFADPMTPIKAEKKAVANSPSRTRGPDIFVYDPSMAECQLEDSRTYILDDIQIIIHRVSRNGRSHRHNDKGICQEGPE